MHKTSTGIIVGLLAGMACLWYACVKPAVSTSLKAHYTEPHRPQYHFSPAEHWMNDPNGMFYFDGEYHLFYQYYPESNVWGPMHWGHAVSRDLAHWEHLPIALYPDSLGLIFSGSTVVDWKNSSGFGKNGQPPMVAMFTYHNMEAEKAGRSNFQYQGIAYSNDRGRTWTKYPGNPVIPNTENIRDFRDTKLRWDESTQQWILIFAAYDHVKLWASKDLKKWTHLSDFGKEWGTHAGVWECPDLFPMSVPGERTQKWVMLVSINPGGPNGGSATQYFIGNFDGKKFTPDEAFAAEVKNGKAVWLDYGKDNYAGVTWSDIPIKDGRRIFLGWMSNWEYATVVPTTAWRSAMTLPRTLHLENTANGLRVFSNPVDEIKSLRGKSVDLSPAKIKNTLELNTGISPTLSELELEFALPTVNKGLVGVELSNDKGEAYRIGYDAGQGQYFSDRTRAGDASFSKDFAKSIHIAPRLSSDKRIRLHLFFDTASVELFADGGATNMTEIFFPTQDFNHIRLFSEGFDAMLLQGKMYGLNSIWQSKNSK